MADFGAGLTGAASGAATGSTFGPWGAVAGGVIGGVTGLFGKKKKKKKPKAMSTLDPQQQELYNKYIASLSGEGEFADLYNFDAEGANANFDANVSRPAYRNFQENIIPGITGQFRQNNLQNSTYTGEALGRAGRNVQENLDAQRANMQFQGQQNAQQNKQQGINNVLNMQTQAYQRPEASKPSTIDQILNTAGPAASEWFANYLSKGKV